MQEWDCGTKGRSWYDEPGRRQSARPTPTINRDAYYNRIGHEPGKIVGRDGGHGNLRVISQPGSSEAAVSIGDRAAGICDNHLSNSESEAP